MPGRKKRFPCGHLGSGQHCHRCAEEDKLRDAAVQAKVDWLSRLSSAPVPLGHLPQDVAEKVLQLIESLNGGKVFHDLSGKRLVTMGQRHVISIPVGRRYRLICTDRSGSLEFVEAISHEEYNNRLSSGGWE